MDFTSIELFERFSFLIKMILTSVMNLLNYRR